jgi:hypothetical protein
MNADQVELEWQFTPADYFAQPITVRRADYTLVIRDGRAVATIDAALYDGTPKMRQTLHANLESRFRAVRLSLVRSSRVRVSSDCVNSARMTFLGLSAASFAMIVLVSRRVKVPERICYCFV